MVSHLGTAEGGEGKGNFVLLDGATFRVKEAWTGTDTPYGYDYWCVAQSSRGFHLKLYQQPELIGGHGSLTHACLLKLALTDTSETRPSLPLP